jgi:four helix bundle protein
MSEMRGDVSIVDRTSKVQRAEMMERTKKFALRIIRLVSKLPKNQVARVIGGQVLRSGTSIGANFREASRAATKKHFTSMMVVALREAKKRCIGSNCWLNRAQSSQNYLPAFATNVIS